MKLVHFFELVRWKNLLILVFVQLLLKYILFNNYNIDTILSNSEFLLFIIAIISSAGSGYVINDIFDIRTDALNKPNKSIVGNKISIRHSIIIYSILVFIALFSGITVSFQVELPIYSVSFLLVVIFLFLYSYMLKGVAIMGNLVVSLLIGFSILITALLDVIPALNDSELMRQLTVIKIIIALAVFSTFINLIREIIKDIEDINGDYNSKLYTLPILIGKKRTNSILLIISFILVISLLYIIISNLHLSKYLLFYGTSFLIIPLVYFCYKLYYAKLKSDYTYLSLVLKIIMIFGVLSILIL